MRALRSFVMLLVCVPLLTSPAWAATLPPNPSIDMTLYLRRAIEAAAQRDTHRVSEDEFLRMSRVPGTVVLDARSRDSFAALHIRDAINLDFSDIAIASLARLIPSRNTTILIYCNNNFRNAEAAFPSKLPMASLNLSTYIALYSYGYRNVYELASTVDIHDSKLPFVAGPARSSR